MNTTESRREFEEFKQCMLDKYVSNSKSEGQVLSMIESSTGKFAFEVWQAARERQWMPIESAPRDGTEIIASGIDQGEGESRHTVIACWNKCEFVDSHWVDKTGALELCYLTHWMPLPPNPPASDPMKEIRKAYAQSILDNRTPPASEKI